MGRPPKEKIEQDEPRVPTVSVLERRLADPESVLQGSTFVPLKDDPDGRKWAERWGNFSQQGRYSELVHQKGWVQVHLSELASRDAVPDLTDKGDGYVWRGDKSRECLLKMPREAFETIKRKEAAIRLGRMHSMSHLKSKIAEEGAKRFGDQAGDELMKLTGDIRELPPERFRPEDIAAMPDGHEV